MTTDPKPVTSADLDLWDEQFPNDGSPGLYGEAHVVRRLSAALRESWYKIAGLEHDYDAEREKVLEAREALMIMTKSNVANGVDAERAEAKLADTETQLREARAELKDYERLREFSIKLEIERNELQAKLAEIRAVVRKQKNRQPDWWCDGKEARDCVVDLHEVIGDP